MKRLPLGIQDFRKIIEGDYLYVDKTHYIYDLINSASYYFLSRPRRFGKSLLLDTIAEAFGGDRELFRGLWIYGSDFGFEKHPVIRLDMSKIANKTPETLENSLLSNLRNRISDEGFGIADDVPSDAFHHLIEMLYKKYGKRVVVLIDEYDKPIVDHLTDIEKAEANRAVLRGFYGILKSMDPFLRMTFFTGVTKFTKTSIFSELNNLLDITLTKDYAGICGIPVEDLGKLFHEHIADLSSVDELRQISSIHDEILTWYDGYSWDGVNRVLNPFGLFSFFIQKRFASYWYASGTPKFLVDLIVKDPGVYTNLKNLRMMEIMLDNYDIREIDAESLLFQTGYLTIKDKTFVGVEYVYTLDMPNHEVRKAFDLHVLSAFSGNGQSRVIQAQMEAGEALMTGNLQKLLDILKGLFASIPYQLHIDREAYYHSIFYAVMNVLGFDVEAEVSTSKGRIDAVLELEGKVYVMEFKYHDCGPDAAPEEKRGLFDKVLDDGMRQIKEKGYADRYIAGGKDIRLAAFAFLGRNDIEMRTEKL